MWKKRSVLQIDEDQNRNYDEDTLELRKRVGIGGMVFKMGVVTNPETGLNEITSSGESNFQFLLKSLSNDELHWILTQTMIEIANRNVEEDEIAKLKLREEMDPRATSLVQLKAEINKK